MLKVSEFQSPAMVTCTRYVSDSLASRLLSMETFNSFWLPCRRGWPSPMAQPAPEPRVPQRDCVPGPAGKPRAATPLRRRAEAAEEARGIPIYRSVHGHARWAAGPGRALLAAPGRRGGAEWRGEIKGPAGGKALSAGPRWDATAPPRQATPSRARPVPTWILRPNSMLISLFPFYRLTG